MLNFFKKPSDENFTYGDITTRLFAFGMDLAITFIFVFIISNYLISSIYPDGNPITPLRVQAVQEHPELGGDPEALGKYLMLKYPNEVRETITQFATATIIQVILLGIYFIYTTYKLGGTLGKKITGIKVVDNITHNRLTLSQSAIRYICSVLSVAALGAGIIFGAFHRRRRTFHDIAADTIVVYDENRWTIAIGRKIKGYFNLK